MLDNGVESSSDGLDLGLKERGKTLATCLSRLDAQERVMTRAVGLHVVTTRLPQIPSESYCFQWIQWTPSDYFPTHLLSKNTKVLLFEYCCLRNIIHFKSKYKTHLYGNRELCI